MCKTVVRMVYNGSTGTCGHSLHCIEPDRDTEKDEVSVCCCDGAGLEERNNPFFSAGKDVPKLHIRMAL